MLDVQLNTGIRDILEEKDSFRLAIRGQAAVESTLNLGIASALGYDGDLPGEFARLPYPTRLTLGNALGIPLNEYREGLLALSKLRHAFAHGRIHELTPADVRPVARAFKRPSGDGTVSDLLDIDVPDKENLPHAALKVVVAVAHASVEAGSFIQKRRREKERGAILFEREVHKLVSKLDLPET